jgi:hypothetical protein
MTMTNTDPRVGDVGGSSGSVAEPGAGWLYFAGTILGVSGLMRIIDSIWAFRYHGSLPGNLQDGVFGSNLKAYAWLWLGVGIVLILASFLVLTQSQLARWVGVVAACIGMVSAAAWLPYYPVWSLVYITLGVLVLHALVTYGGRTSA